MVWGKEYFLECSIYMYLYIHCYTQKIHSFNKCLITIGRKYEKVVETNSYFLHSFWRCPVKTMNISQIMLHKCIHYNWITTKKITYLYEIKQNYLLRTELRWSKDRSILDSHGYVIEHPHKLTIFMEIKYIS